MRPSKRQGLLGRLVYGFARGRGCISGLCGGLDSQKNPPKIPGRKPIADSWIRMHIWHPNFQKVRQKDRYFFTSFDRFLGTMVIRERNLERKFPSRHVPSLRNRANYEVNYLKITRWKEEKRYFKTGFRECGKQRERTVCQAVKSSRLCAVNGIGRVAHLSQTGQQHSFGPSRVVTLSRRITREETALPVVSLLL